MLTSHNAHLAIILLFLCLATSCSQSGTAPITDKQGQAQEQAKSSPEAPPSETKQPDNAANLGVVLTHQLQKSGSDVTVLGFEDVLVFDCTKALDPRMACYARYKGYPADKGELKLLRLMGIRKLHFQTEGGVFSGYAWTKRIG